MLRALCLFSVLLIGAGPAAAQPAPEALVRAWLAEQAAAAEAVTHAAVAERAVHTADGPFGQRHMEVEGRLRGQLRRPETWTRNVDAIRINGRPVPPRHYERFERGGPLPQRKELLAPPLPPVRLLRGLRPAGPPAPATVEGVSAWRLDALPRTAETLLDRATLWFGRAEGRLLRSRVILRPPRAGGPTVVTTDYDRVEGLDLPRRRQAEGTTRTRRRLRTFTVVYALDVRYEGYTLTRATER